MHNHSMRNRHDQVGDGIRSRNKTVFVVDHRSICHEQLESFAIDLLDVDRLSIQHERDSVGSQV